MRISRRTRNAATGVACALFGAAAWAVLAGSVAAQDLLGQPTPGATTGLQPAATDVARTQHFFHNAILTPIIVIITLFVFGLLLYVSVRFSKKRNPVPARFTHNTPIEVVWTIAPVLILLFIAIFSYKLLFQYNDTPRADFTVKATGYQWYWGYEYPDQGIAEITSVMLPEDEAKRRGVPFRLAVDNPMVVPQGAVVKVLVTGADVIHSFGIPAFGYTFDAIPGRVNETWFKVDKPGVYYGQCRELCGVDHAFMPIQINVVPRAEWAAWVAANGGSMGRAATAAAEAPPTTPGAGAAPNTSAPQPAVAAAAGGTPAAASVPAAPTPAAASPNAPNPAGGDPRPNVPDSSAPAAPAAAPAQ